MKHRNNTKKIFRGLEKDFKPIAKDVEKAVNEIVDLPNKALSEAGHLLSNPIIPIVIVGAVVLFVVMKK